MKQTIKNIEQWFYDRNLHTQDPRIQLTKTIEELGELASAINKNDRIEQIDAIGDVTVTLIGIAIQLNLDYQTCVQVAYNEIKDRKGKLINGVFVKEEDLIEEYELEDFKNEK